MLNRLCAIRWRVADILRTAAKAFDGGTCFVLRRPPGAIIDQATLEKCMALAARHAIGLANDELTAIHVEETMRAALPSLYDDKTR